MYLLAYLYFLRRGKGRQGLLGSEAEFRALGALPCLPLYHMYYMHLCICIPNLTLVLYAPLFWTPTLTLVLYAPLCLFSHSIPCIICTSVFVFQLYHLYYMHLCIRIPTLTLVLHAPLYLYSHSNICIICTSVFVFPFYQLYYVHLCICIPTLTSVSYAPLYLYSYSINCIMCTFVFVFPLYRLHMHLCNIWQYLADRIKYVVWQISIAAHYWIPEFICWSVIGNNQDAKLEYLVNKFLDLVNLMTDFEFSPGESDL